MEVRPWLLILEPRILSSLVACEVGGAHSDITAEFLAEFLRISLANNCDAVNSGQAV
jgi:hypothetical protein